MRVDRLLFFLRLTKTRALAQSLVEAGHLRMDGRRVAKPSEEARAGSVIAFPQRGAVRIVRVIALPVRRGPPAEARACYEEIDEGGAAT